MWTDEKIALLRTMWDEGKTSREIAEEIGKSRNAVIGQVHRLGLKKRPRNGEARPFKYIKKGLPVNLRTKSRKDFQDVKTKALGTPVKMVDLLPIHCRWPIGDPKKPDFHFCGADKHEKGPYCAPHSVLAWSQNLYHAD